MKDKAKVKDKGHDMKPFTDKEVKQSKVASAALAKFGKGKAKAKAKAKVMEEEDEAKATAARVKMQPMKGKVKKEEDGTKATAAAKKQGKAQGNAAAAMKRPASSAKWDAWAEMEDDDDEEEEEPVLEEKDFEPPSKAQAKVFDDALRRPPGTRGSLPPEIREMWNKFQRGPGAIQERHALRNLIVPKSAGYSHVCTIDPDGPLMNKVKEVFEIKHHKVQMKGFTESEVLFKQMNGNEGAMEKALAKGHLKFVNGMYYWHRDIHEHTKGGKFTMKFGGGEPHAMTLDDKDKMMELLDYAPWANWVATQDIVPEHELKKIVKPDSDSMNKAQECLDACKAVCISTQNFFKQLQKEGILASPEAGSIPSIMKTAINAANQMEKDHMQPIAELIYDTDGTKNITVKSMRNQLYSAAQALTLLKQHLDESKALVQKFKAKDKKKAVLIWWADE